RLKLDYDDERFYDDVVKSIDTEHVQAEDIQRWLDGIEAYRVQEAQIRQAVAELRKKTEEYVRLVRDSGLEEKQERDFADKQRIVEFYIQQVGQQKFIQRDIDSGDFGKAKERVLADVASLRSFVRMET